MTRCHPMHPSRIRCNLLFASALVVLAIAGCGDQPADQTEAPAEDAGATAAAVTFVAVDIDYEQAPDEVAPGSHTIELVNDGALPHTITIEELDDRDIVEAEGGQTATGEVELDAGAYTYYCSVPGHREAGMEGTLEVAEDAG